MRRCGECGYDITRVAVVDRRRRCSECGHVGRGVRPCFGPGWALWRGARPVVIGLGIVLALWVTAVVLSNVRSARMTDAPLVFRLLWGVAAFGVAMVAFGPPIVWAQVWGRSLPRCSRRWLVVGLALAGVVLNYAMLGTVIAVLGALGLSAGLEPLADF